MTAKAHQSSRQIRDQESDDRDQTNYRRLRRRRKIVETPIGFSLIFPGSNAAAN
jgi:hypothetical protein